MKEYLKKVSAYKFLTGLFLLLAPMSHILADDVAIIANKQVSISEISSKQATDLWLGKKKQVSGSGILIPVDIGQNERSYKDFYQKVVNKNPKQVKLYWGKQMFGGKNFPPKRLYDDASILKWVSETANGVGYVNANNVNDTVKVLATFK